MHRFSNSRVSYRRTQAPYKRAIAAGCLLLVAAGFAVGRGTGTPNASRSTTANSGAPSSSQTLAQPTSAASAHGTAPQTQAGAITAAADADCVLGGPLVTAPAQYRVALRNLLAPDKQADAAGIAQAESAQVDTQTGVVTAAAQGAHVYVSCVPLGYRVETYTATTASVSVWSEQIVAIDQVYAPASAYVTETLHLRWLTGAGGGWKLESSDLLDTQWAPTPQEPSLPETGTLPAQLTNFTPFGSN